MTKVGGEPVSRIHRTVFSPPLDRLRGSDVVRLRWTEVDFQSGEITRLTLKRRKRVLVPMHAELSFALEAESQRRSPSPEDLVLLNPATGKPFTRPRLYERIRALGRRAKMADPHPHRFRDTFSVDMLARGVNPYNVARLVGITVEMLERHYAPFIPARTRPRRAEEWAWSRSRRVGACAKRDRNSMMRSPGRCFR